MKRRPRRNAAAERETEEELQESWRSEAKRKPVKELVKPTVNTNDSRALKNIAIGTVILLVVVALGYTTYRSLVVQWKRITAKMSFVRYFYDTRSSLDPSTHWCTFMANPSAQDRPPVIDHLTFHEARELFALLVQALQRGDLQRGDSAEHVLDTMVFKGAIERFYLRLFKAIGWIKWHQNKTSETPEDVTMVDSSPRGAEVSRFLELFRTLL